jgi:Glycosyl hydrolase family 26
VVAATGLLAAVGAGCAGAGADTTSLPSVNVGAVPFGVYVGSGQPRAVARFAARTGAEPSLASDYLPRTNGWRGMVDVKPLHRFLAPWRASGYQLLLGVPMIPTRDGRPMGTLAAGAAGTYDEEFTTLARTLVHYGEGNAILRLGWEFNGTWYPWSVTNQTDAAHFAAYFRNIVTTMRVVPGSSFRYVWNPTSGSEPESARNAYPGDAYVDYVGLDLYDQVWGIPLDPTLAWPRYVTEADGLQWLSSFASAHDKPAVIPEWGVTIRSDGHGLGDDPLFVAKMAQWIATHRVAFTSYFDVDAPDGQHDLLDRAFSQSLTVFERSFHASRPVPLPSAVVVPTPTS